MPRFINSLATSKSAFATMWYRSSISLDSLPKLGATGRFGYGKLNPDDEGELAGAITIEKGFIKMHFGPKAVTWVSLPPVAARQLARILLDRADKIEGRRPN